MLLEVNNLNITTGSPQKVICKSVGFNLNPGETLGILGESGSGKSITALSILQILPSGLHCTSGTIFYYGQNTGGVDLLSLPGHHMNQFRGKHISMVFQEPMTSLNPVLTCGKQVDEILRNHFHWNPTTAREYTLELFAKVKLPNPKQIYRSYPYQLSGGQKQRIMIAMAIACKPQILIADEPTTALDVSVQKSILELLKELQREMGMAIIFITHDISVLSEIANRVLVFYKGEIVEEGNIKDILLHARHPYTIGLMNCRRSMEKKGERLISIHDPTVNNIKSATDTLEPHSSDRELIPVFRVNNLLVSFPTPKTSIFKGSQDQVILKKINLEVFRYETLGIVGESGSGKTTLGRTLLKLIDSASGNIQFQGMDISKLQANDLKKFRQKVQIIFQDPYSSLNPKITVGEAIYEPLLVHRLCQNKKERKKRVIELLEMVGLSEEHYFRYPHQFSGGQRQRIGIARALALEPELIVFDESFAALDVSIQAQILNLINDLKKAQHLTYLFISHDLNMVRYMSDRIIVLKNGEIAEQGLAEDIFNNPQNEYTKMLLNAIPGK